MTGETEVGGRPTLLVGRLPPAFNRHLVDPHNPTSTIQPVAQPKRRPAPKLDSTQANPGNLYFWATLSLPFTQRMGRGGEVGGEEEMFGDGGGGQPGGSIGASSATGSGGRLRHYTIPPHWSLGGPTPLHLHSHLCQLSLKNRFSTFPSDFPG